MKASSIVVETSRSTSQSDSIVRQTSENSSILFYTTMNNVHIFKLSSSSIENAFANYIPVAAPFLRHKSIYFIYIIAIIKSEVFSLITVFAVYAVLLVKTHMFL